MSTASQLMRFCSAVHPSLIQHRLVVPCSSERVNQLCRVNGLKQKPKIPREVRADQQWLRYLIAAASQKDVRCRIDIPERRRDAHTVDRRHLHIRHQDVKVRCSCKFQSSRAVTCNHRIEAVFQEKRSQFARGVFIFAYEENARTVGHRSVSLLLPMAVHASMRKWRRSCEGRSMVAHPVIALESTTCISAFAARGTERSTLASKSLG